MNTPSQKRTSAFLAFAAWLAYSFVLISPSSAAPRDPCSEGAVDAAAGQSGVSVNALQANEDCGKRGFARGDGTWVEVTNTPDCHLDRGKCFDVAYCEANGEEGTWLQTIVHHPDGSTEPGDSYCSANGPAPLLQVTPAMAARAFKETPIPTSRTSIAPPHGFVLINRPFVMSTTAESFSRGLRILIFDVTLDIQPSSYLWHVGSDTFTSDWPGRPYTGGDSSGYLTYTPKSPGALPVSVDVTWSATFSVNGGPAQPVPGTVTRPGPVTNLTSQTGQGTIPDSH